MCHFINYNISNVLSQYVSYYNFNMKGGINMFKLKKEYTEYEYKSLRLPKDLITKVQKLANDNSMSFNKVVIQCIEYAMEHTDEE